MTLFTEKEILRMTTETYAECGRSDPEECDRRVGKIIESLRNEGNLQLAIEVAGNLATREVRVETMTELEREAQVPVKAKAA